MNITLYLQAAFVFASAMFVVSCAGPNDPLQTANNLKPEKYAGKWHEVARLPNFFERGVVAASATYGQVAGSDQITVFNQGLKESGKRTQIRGKATPVGNTPNGEARLEVRFNKFPASLFAGDYWIIHLNDAHTRAVVGTPDRKFLWLLAKNPKDQVSDFKVALKQAQQNGFAIERIILNPQRLK